MGENRDLFKEMQG